MIGWFVESRSSVSVRAGSYVKQPAGYVAFHPASFPPADLQLSPALVGSLSRADQALARLDGAASVIPDVDLFTTMYIRDEATRSSQIEGTQATLADVVEAEVSRLNDERRDAVAEIQNYITALDLGLRRLADLPVSLRLLREIHAELMSGVRGGTADRTPGEFRRTQNWIGGSSPSNARFVPPPVEQMQAALHEWEVAMALCRLSRAVPTERTLTERLAEHRWSRDTPTTTTGWQLPIGREVIVVGRCGRIV